jgi:hypothetical protein
VSRESRLHDDDLDALDAIEGILVARVLDEVLLGELDVEISTTVGQFEWETGWFGAVFVVVERVKDLDVVFRGEMLVGGVVGVRIATCDEYGAYKK